MCVRLYHPLLVFLDEHGNVDWQLAWVRELAASRLCSN